MLLPRRGRSAHLCSFRRRRTELENAVRCWQALGLAPAGRSAQPCARTAAWAIIVACKQRSGLGG